MPSLELRVLLDTCLRDGVFPGTWKKANLLIPKPGKRGKYRPICLLGETGTVRKNNLGQNSEAHTKSGSEREPVWF